MKLKTSKFDEIKFNEENIITFTEPILGFEDYKRFVLIEEESTIPLKWLQSVENPYLAFPVIEPVIVFKNYTISMPLSEVEDIGLSSPEDGCVFTLVVIPKDITKTRTNLKAPIIYNVKTGLAKQVVLHNSDYPIDFVFADAQVEGGEISTEGDTSDYEDLKVG